MVNKKIAEKLLDMFQLKFYAILGLFYARVVVKTFIAHLIRNYRLTTPYKKLEDLKIEQFVVMSLADKHMVKLACRE